MNFSIIDLFSKFDQIRRELRIWSHVLNKSVVENFFCAVTEVLLIILIQNIYCFIFYLISKAVTKKN